MAPSSATDGSKTWTAAHLFDKPELWATIHRLLNANKFKAAVTAAFALPDGDNFAYHATSTVTLSQVEAAIHAGRANGLHAWYVEPAAPSHSTSPHGDSAAPSDDGMKNLGGATNGSPVQEGWKMAGYPPPSDIQAYVGLFDPTKAAAGLLKSFGANAKKASLRASVAEYLLSKRYLEKSILVPKLKLKTRSSSQRQERGSDTTKDDPTQSTSLEEESAKGTASTPEPEQGHQNPALDFWAYSCMALEYTGPNIHTARVHSSHHMLPVYMHHFGCVVPSWEALEIIAKLTSAPAHTSVLDMGSGNGYWTLLLRRLGVHVVAVDSGQSRWRTTWIADTVVTDGVQYLRRRSGCPDHVLLLVYPIVRGEFTRRVLDAYTGDTVIVAGTQNGNGYTGFKDMMVDEYVARERPGWDKIAQVPLPSFPGKDDALFAFRRKAST